MAAAGSIGIVGVGDAGGHALHFVRSELPGGLAYLLINTNQMPLLDADVPDYLLLGADFLHGLGSGGNAMLANRAAKAAALRLYELFAGMTEVYLLAGLGGGTGTGATPIIARIARESGAVVTAVVSLPFPYEGAQREQLAVSGLAALQPWVDHLVTVDSRRLLRYTTGPQVVGLEAAYRLLTAAVGWQVLARLVS